MTPEPFGQMTDGTPVQRVTISGGGLRARIITYGGVLQDLRLDGHDAPLVLGFDSLADYLAHSPNFGAIVGRYANRIRDGRCVIDGQEVTLDRNFRKRHLLHGGHAGTSRRNWRLEELHHDRVQLMLDDPGGNGGFPGTLRISCLYHCSAEGTLRITLTAQTDAPTLCNLAHHSYFNLQDGGTSTVLTHELQVLARQYLPVDHDLIPTGTALPVAGTAFDLQTPRALSQIEAEAAPLDHNFCLAPARRSLSHAARLLGGPKPGARLGLDVWTTEPGLQAYGGANLAVPVPGLEGRLYPRHAGIALEPQIWPDAPNNPDFPQAFLWPSQTYHQLTEYRFFRAIA